MKRLVLTAPVGRGRDRRRRRLRAHGPDQRHDVQGREPLRPRPAHIQHGSAPLDSGADVISVGNWPCLGCSGEKPQDPTASRCAASCDRWGHERRVLCSDSGWDYGSRASGATGRTLSTGVLRCYCCYGSWSIG